MNSPVVRSLSFLAFPLVLAAAVNCGVAAADPESDQRTIRVSAVDSSGESIAGVEIRRSVWTDQKDFDRNESFVTDADGVAEVTLPGTMRILRLWTDKEGFAPLFANWGTSEIARVTGEVKLVIPHGTTIGGIVVDQAGKPIAGAKVAVRCGGGGEQLNPGLPVSYSSGLAGDGDAPRTDDQGRWKLNGVPPGDDVVLSLKLSHPDYIQDEFWGQLQGINGVTTSQLREQSARIMMNRGRVLRGRVVDGDANPVPGALVTWSGRDSWSVGENKVITDDDGEYQLPPQPTGKLYVAVAAEGRKPQSTEVDLAKRSEPLDFALQPGNVLQIRVVDVDGDPIPDAGVVIERWRGVYSFIHGRQTELFQSEKPNKTDKDGVYQWESAPDEAVKLRIAKRGWSSAETELAAEPDVHTITLHRAVVISGRVVDDSTGQPIPRSELFPVSYYPLRPNDPIVQRTQMRVVRDGEYSHTESSWDVAEELMLQFESLGYRPKRVGPFNATSGTASVDVRLEKASPLRGRVLGVDGRPIAGATVSFATKDSSLLVSDWSYDRNGFSTRTDDGGHFVFSATMTPPVIIATHESGYREVALDLNQQPGDLQLQPWSRVEGRLTQGGEPVAGVNISVRPIRMLGGDNPHVQDAFHASTDLQGRFQFDRLPPVPSCLSPYLSVWRECLLTSSRRVPLALAAGETHRVVLGEEGIVVRGKVRPAGDLASSLDLNYCLNYLLQRAPGITPPDPIARAGFDWRDGWSFDLTSSQEGRGFLNTLHHHFVKFESDGTFAIHGVSDGDYEFAVSIYEPPEGCLIDPVGLDVLEFSVGEDDLRRGELDLGEIEIDVALGPSVGEPFPNFRYQDVKDDELHSVADMKGRYVLIDFWATWCAPCVKVIPELRAAARRFDAETVTLLSVSLDEQREHARAFIAEKNMDWPQALLGQRDNPFVRQQLGISSVPVYYLLDPEGRLLHRSFRLPDATAALEKALEDAASAESK